MTVINALFEIFELGMVFRCRDDDGRVNMVLYTHLASKTTKKKVLSSTRVLTIAIVVPRWLVMNA